MVQNWVPYPFRYKPQDPSKPPGITRRIQPRFDWNLWFASLGSWQDYSIVPEPKSACCPTTRMFSAFLKTILSQKPPQKVRAVLWQYWFTKMSEKTEHRSFGGTGNLLDSMLLRWNANRMAPSVPSNGLRPVRASEDWRRSGSSRGQPVQSGQRHPRRMIATHAVYSSTGGVDAEQM